MADGRGISRRTLLVTGGTGVGLVVAFAMWPRRYETTIRAAPGESLLNAFIRIDREGAVTIAIPQAELGQGVYTSLPQIAADALGADWRTIGVEAAPISPLYANTLAAAEMIEGVLPDALADADRWIARERATRSAWMMTGGSTSIRMFEPALREAGAGARALLMKAAAERWQVDWETLDTAQGFVVNGKDRIRFGDLAEAAAALELPEVLPLRGGTDDRLVGQSLPRLDLPAKVDGTAQFAGDIRLPDMLYASVRAGPIGDSRLVSVDKAAADKVPGVLAVFEMPGWAGAVATNWWAANKAIEAMKPVFTTPSGLSSRELDGLLRDTIEHGEATRYAGHGDIDAALAGPGLFRAHYSAGPAPNAPLETLTATARLIGDRLELWAPAQAPALARAAAARAAGLPPGQVTLYRPLIGGGYGRKLEAAAIEQAVAMTIRMKRPVQLVWSRIEEAMQDSLRPPMRAEMIAQLADGGRVTAWRARIAVPSGIGAALARLAGEPVPVAPEAVAVAGALPPYDIPNVAVEHLPLSTPLRTGVWRGGAHAYTVFATECFIDELARRAGIEPLSFRMQMLNGNPRLARTLSTVAGLGGWDGGGGGSSLGIAAHSAFGSHVATLVDASVGADQRVRVARVVCAVDCGRVINSEIVRQQIEGGIMHAIGGATGEPIRLARGLPQAHGFRDLALPRLADTPDIMVELAENDEEPGGVTELGVPTVAPAIANAVFAATGQRLRSLPLQPGRQT